MPDADAESDDMDLIGLSFSGGGIRSATFNLGILQALAKKGVLRHVDYLSTVSGGGYIGSWLSAMIHRADQTAPAGKHGLDQIEPSLDPDHPKPPSSLPQNAIAYLRAYSNYLTPKVSLLSADAWTMAAIWFRNTILNLTILVSGIAAIMLAARCFGIFALVPTPIRNAGWGAADSAAIAFLLLSSIFLGLNISEKLPKSWRSEGAVQLLVVVPAIVAAMAVTVLIRNNRIPPDTAWIMMAGSVLSVLFLIFQLTAGFWNCFRAQHHDMKAAGFCGAVLLVLVAVLSGLVTAWLFHLLAELMEKWNDGSSIAWLLLTVCPPIVLTVLALGVILNIGLLGRDIPDGVREWAGRLGAWVLIYSGIWLLFFGAAIYGPVGLQQSFGWAKYVVTGSWVAATVGGIMAGKSSSTGKDSDKGGAPTSGVLDFVARLGPYIFMVGFVVAISLGVHEIVCVSSDATAPPLPARNAVVQVNETGTKVDVSIDSKAESADLETIRKQYWKEMESQKFVAAPSEWYKGTLTLLVLCIVVALMMAWRVDINEFSLNHFYKNRLVRCYLAASRLRQEREPDPFTHFDRHDDVPLNQLDNDKFSGPFPIINATLNLSAGRNLAWQERQGASFIFTPIYSGYDTGGENDSAAVSRQARVQEGIADPAYYLTRWVSKTEKHGIMIGTAAGISGAAANPNQGFHTSTAVAFLMTVFDVRLGWWLGNPASQTRADWSGPTFGLPYTLSELFGTSDANSAFVSLSDGGHFENMGLYELIRRRCRYIIICDAEQDEQLQFGGITTAVRMCRTDFGVEIEFKKDKGLANIARTGGSNLEKFSGAHYAIADIKYPGLATLGTLIYIKSSITADEPADVLGYHTRVPQFPHESTGDQWFDESQFESYRRLGQHIGETVFGDKVSGRAIAALGKQAYFDTLAASDPKA